MSQGEWGAPRQDRMAKCSTVLRESRNERDGENGGGKPTAVVDVVSSEECSGVGAPILTKG